MGKTDLWPVTSLQLFYSLASNIWLKSLSVAFVISCFTVLQLYAIPWFLTMYARKLEFESCSFFHEICLIEKILQTFYLQGFNTLVFCCFFLNGLFHFLYNLGTFWWDKVVTNVTMGIICAYHNKTTLAV